MVPFIEYEKILFNSGWHQISTTLWSLKNDDTGSVIYLDFCKDEKGVFYCNDKDGQPLPVDIIEEFNEVVLFRKKQGEIDKGIPQERWEIGE